MDVNTLVELMESVKEERYNKLKSSGGVIGIGKHLCSTPLGGLESTVDIEERRKAYGCNKIQGKKPKTFFSFVWEAATDPLLICLTILATITFGFSFYSAPKKSDEDEVREAEEENESNTEWIESVAIYSAVVVITMVTAVTDWKKQKQFAGLQSKIEDRQEVSLIRAGGNKRLPATEVVVGDVCQIKYGDSIPADGIVFQCNDLKVDEASISGESDPAKKTITGDCFLFSGTKIMEGSGKMLVTAVGMHSQTGKIMHLLEASDDKKEEGKDNKPVDEDRKRKDRSVLQNKLTKLALQIANIGFFIATLAVLELISRYALVHYGLMQEDPSPADLDYLFYYITIGVTVLVVAIPEGLPLAVTLALAYSIKQMMNENNLVRHLYACETMGNATTICSDKTGTLTENRMTVVENYLFCVENIKISDLNASNTQLLAESISVNTSYTSDVQNKEHKVNEGTGSAQCVNKLTTVGNSTECALLGFLLESQIDYKSYRNQYPEESFIKVYTFNSSRKCMATVIDGKNDGKPCLRLLCKGASEIVLEKCKYINDQNGVKDLTRDETDRILKQVVEKMACEGLRTLCLAYKDFQESSPNWENEEEIMCHMTCIGIVGIKDPVRKGVPEAIKQCQKAGITVRMVTGDNLLTAKSIATQCGIVKGDEPSAVMTGVEFNKRICNASGEFSQALFDSVWPKLRVLARAQPTDKYVLVKGIIDSSTGQTKGEVVAVTGDGTNDAPALKKADVGFAMGITGTDVAKEASDIILTDDNFTSIVKAVLWGRNVYDSIAKFLQFQLTVNVVAVFVAFVGACVIQDSPLKTMQMLWVNLIMDTGASLALATESPTIALLDRKPYGRWKPLISPTMAKNIICHAVYQIMVVMIMIFAGDVIFDIENGRYANVHAPPSQHFTLVFNVFVLMTLFNEINARTIHGERNVFKGLFTNKIYLSIIGGSFVLQVFIIELGGVAFSTASLGVELWMWSIFFGLSSLVWGQIITCIPNSFIRGLYKTSKKKSKVGVALSNPQSNPEEPSVTVANEKSTGKNTSKSVKEGEDDDETPDSEHSLKAMPGVRSGRVRMKQVEDGSRK